MFGSCCVRALRHGVAWRQAMQAARLTDSNAEKTTNEMRLDGCMMSLLKIRD
jgi:hypothetical protein